MHLNFMSHNVFIKMLAGGAKGKQILEINEMNWVTSSWVTDSDTI